MRYFAALLLVVVGAVAAFGSDQVPNLQQARYNVFTAGQPTEEGYKELAALGIKTVINVLPEAECIPGEPELATARGMTYHSVPFETTGFKMETVRHFAEVLKNANQPVLIHCSTGNHVGGLWFAYRILVEKAPLPHALREARKIGMTPELENSIFNWVMNEQDKLAAR